MSWNLIVQSNFGGRSPGSCLRGILPGIAQPAQIHLVSCCASTDALTRAVLAWLIRHLRQPSAGNCSGPGSNGFDGGLECMAFGEPSCRHVLVLFKGAGVAIDPSVQSLADDWIAKAGANGQIAMVLPAGEGGSNLPANLQHYHWLFHPAPDFELGLPILRAAGIGGRQKLFLSYRRQDTLALADQMHEALTRRGFKVYLDRFSWTPGRLFPEEIAEELADRGVILLLESSRLHLSRWTQWELAFARTYHFGLLAINVNSAPLERGIDVRDRWHVTSAHNGQLSGPNLQAVVDFVARRYSIAETKRRIYFEALVRRAASYASAALTVRPDGLFEVSGNGHSALFLPSGRPANLADISRLSRACSSCSSGPPPGILIGQHEHLAADMRQDVGWLAQRTDLCLASVMKVFPAVRNVIQTGRP
jgi:hypothetical protein